MSIRFSYRIFPNTELTLMNLISPLYYSLCAKLVTAVLCSVSLLNKWIETNVFMLFRPGVCIIFPIICHALSILSLGSYEEDKYIVTEQTLNIPYWT